ncbi:site-specific integrase [Alphaproteobacteria bacterium]|nr:site-specific integrase [Alphaproteobacteria bacterium]
MGFSLGTDVNNKIDVRGDGLVVLYQRQNRDSTINPIFQMRIRLPLTASKGYFRGSTGESNQGNATQIALNKYEELYFKVKSGGTLLGKSFRDLFEEWKSHYPKISNESLPQYVEWSINRVGNYPFRFFVEENGNPKVDEITPQQFEEYYVYRKQNSVRNGKHYSPSNDTIRKELTLLNQMFSYGFEKGYIVKEPKIKLPSPEKDSRRPSFSKEEWRKITAGMRKRVKEGWGAHKRDRHILQQYVLILANCGVRLGELRHLKWDDVRRETYDDDDGKKTIRIILLVKGKTGIREVVCNQGTEAFFERLYDYRKEELNSHPSPDTFVFCHQDGKPIKTMRRAFDSLLADLNLRTNSMGRNRTLYSLRHMYATFRLSEEVSPYLLARQMGTSVEMLEKHYGQVVNRLVATQITKTRSRHTVKVSDQVYPF